MISQYIIDTLGASLLGNILAGKGINRAGERIVRAGEGNKRFIKNQEAKGLLSNSKHHYAKHQYQVMFCFKSIKLMKQ